jgi:hypothetical protein
MTHVLTTRRIGRNVIIEQQFGGPKITKGEYIVSLYSAFPRLALPRQHCPTTSTPIPSSLVDLVLTRPFSDGVTVAKSIQLKDKFENLGAR